MDPRCFVSTLPAVAALMKPPSRTARCSRLFRPWLCAKNHLHAVRSTGRWSLGPEQAVLALLALSPLPRAGTCAQQTLPNAAGRSRSMGHLHVGAWWPLTEMPSRAGGAEGHGCRYPPVLGAQLPQSQSVPVPGALFLWAASPWAQGGGSGSRSGWQGLVPCPRPWEQSPPRGGRCHAGREHSKGRQGGGRGS